MTEEVKIMSNLLKQFENKQLKQENIPEYHPGDTLEVQVQIEETNRVRTQTFEGVLIKKRDRGISSSFTLRKKSYGEGVERTFNIHSPSVKKITIKRRGKVRQAKLYYLHDLTAKKARITEKIVKRNKGDDKA